MKTQTEKIMEVKYEIDSNDWGNNCEIDRHKCVSELEQWFDGLSLKSQLSIYYAQRCANDMQNKDEAFDPFNDGCPVIGQVYAAQHRIIERFAPWVHTCTSGFNFNLYTTGVA